MNKLTSLFAIAALATTAGIAQARDLGPDEALSCATQAPSRTSRSSTRRRLAKYPGGKIEDTELEQEHGRYVYQVELRDAQGVQWDVELDATNGQILEEHRDD